MMEHSSGTKSSSGGKIPPRSDLREGVPTRAYHRRIKQRQCFTFAAWNVRTLLDRTNSNRPERRTALVSQELHRLSIDVAALSETRFADEGSLTEEHYTFFWKGHPATHSRIHGVGIAVKNRHKFNRSAYWSLRTSHDPKVPHIR